LVKFFMASLNDSSDSDFEANEVWLSDVDANIKANTIAIPANFIKGTHKNLFSLFIVVQLLTLRKSHLQYLRTQNGRKIGSIWSEDTYEMEVAAFLIPKQF
jgi:hypothetical protein